MTLANNYAPINLAGDGTTVAFSGSWQMIDPSYAQVFLQNNSTGVQTLVTQGVAANQYQIALSSSGFIVTFNTAPAAGNDVIIARMTTPDQTDPYSTARGFQGGVEEDSFDKLTAIAQENVETVGRNISAPLGDSATSLVLPTPALRASKLLGFDASGNVIIVAGSSGGTIISAPMIPVVQAVSVAAALALLGGASSSSVAASIAALSAITFQTINIQRFTSNGTYTPSAGMICAIVEMCGGGGATGGAAAGGNTSPSAGSGAYLKALVTAAQIGASKAVTIGAAGVAGASGSNTTGTAGTATSLGSLLSCAGGLGTTGNSGTVAGATGGAPTVTTGTPILLINGGDGGNSSQVGGNPVGANINMPGGSNPLGIGGAGYSNQAGSNDNGRVGKGYGAGASGASGGGAGANGTAGIVIIIEFCS